MVINESNEGKLKEQLSSWYPVMKDLIQSDTWDSLYKYLKSQSQAGKVIMPASAAVWKSLKLTDRTKVKAIILFGCPYTTIRDKVVITNGIPVDCSNIAPYQAPANYLWHQAIEAQYGFSPDNDLRCSLEYLLEEEHILMMHTIGTTEKDKVNSHESQWHEVTKWFIENVINKYMAGIPIVLIGPNSAKFEKYLNPLANPIKKVESIDGAAYNGRPFKHMDMHLWIDNIIRANNGESEVPRWTRKIGEGKKVEPEYPDFVTTPMPSYKAVDSDIPKEQLKEIDKLPFE